MIKVNNLVDLLKNNSCNFFSGVPDSVLKELSFFLRNKNKKNHIIATNEGSAISIGIGYYLAKKKITMYLYAKFWALKCHKSINFSC